MIVFATNGIEFVYQYLQLCMNVYLLGTNFFLVNFEVIVFRLSVALFSAIHRIALMFYIGQL